MSTGLAQQESRLKDLISKGREQGYLTYAEVNDHLPDDISDPEQIEDIIGMINDMGITVHEKAPDAESLVLSDAAVSTVDDVADEAVAAPPYQMELGCEFYLARFELDYGVLLQS